MNEKGFILKICFIFLLGIYLTSTAYSSPSITIIEPDNNTYLSQNFIFFNITSDENLNQSILQFGNSTGFFNFSFTNNSMTSWQINLTGSNTTFSNTTYNYTILAQNTSGLWNQTSTRFVSLDTISPNQAGSFTTTNTLVSTITSSRTLNGSSFTLNWTLATDSGSYVDHYELKSRNRTFDEVNNNFSDWSSWFILNSSIPNSTTNTLLILSEEYQYEFNLTSVDAANNTNSTSPLNVTVDSSGPKLAFYSNGTAIRIPLQWTNQTNLTILANISDVSGIDNETVNATFNGTSVSLILSPAQTNQTNQQVNFSVVNLEGNKNYTVVISATDSLGKLNTSISYNVSTDFTSPSSITALNLSVPFSDSGEWFKDNVTYQVSCSDSLSGISDYFTNESSFNSWISSTNSTHNFTINDNGNLSYIFKCRDTAGNENSTTVFIPVDAEDPSITVKTPSGTGEETSVDIIANYTDNQSGIDTSIKKLEFKSGSGSFEDVTSSATFTATGVNYDPSLSSSTEYTVKLTVCDKVATDIDDSSHCDTETWVFTTKSSSSTNGDSSGGGSGGGSSEESTNSSTNTTSPTTPSLVWKEIPAETSIIKGENKTIDLTLENSGAGKIKDIVLSIAGILSASLDKTTITSLAEKESTNVRITILTSENDSTSSYNLTLKAQGNEASTITVLKVKVQPLTEEREEINQSVLNLNSQIFDLKTKLERANKTLENETLLNSVINLINESEEFYKKSLESLEKGDYAEALEFQKQAEEKIKAAEKALDIILASGNNNIILYILIPFLVLAIIGIILYVSLVPDKPSLKEVREKVSSGLQKHAEKIIPSNEKEDPEILEKLTTDRKSRTTIIGDLISEREDFEKDLGKEKPKEKDNRPWFSVPKINLGGSKAENKKELTEKNILEETREEVFKPQPIKFKEKEVIVRTVEKPKKEITKLKVDIDTKKETKSVGMKIKDEGAEKNIDEKLEKKREIKRKIATGLGLFKDKVKDALKK